MLHMRTSEERTFATACLGAGRWWRIPLRASMTLYGRTNDCLMCRVVGTHIRCKDVLHAMEDLKASMEQTLREAGAFAFGCKLFDSSRTASQDMKNRSTDTRQR